MFGIGGWELLVIVAVALLVLGPRRLPAAARAVGKGLQSLRRATIDLRRSIELDPEMEDLPQTIDEINRPLVAPVSLMGSTPRSRPKPDQDYGDVPPPPDPRNKSDSGRKDGADEDADAAPEEGSEEPSEVASDEPAAASDEPAPATDEPAAETVERTTTRRSASSAKTSTPSTDDDGGEEEGS